MGINFSKYSGSTTTQKYKKLHGNLFSLKRKIIEQTLNNFTILNKDCNTQKFSLNKKKTFFFFLFTALFLSVYLSQFSLTVYLSFLFYSLTHLRNSLKTALILTFSGTSPLFTTKWPNGLSFYFFTFFFFSSFILFTSSHNKCEPTCLDFCA